MRRTGESFGLLNNDTPELQRLEGLGDFCHFDLPKNGENIGTWLHRTHSKLSAQPSFIGSHIVDGASNAQSSVEELKWQSREERPQTITSRSCIAHETSTSAVRGSGTSAHKHNMNPQAGIQLKKLHTHMVVLNRSGTRKAVLTSVRKEEERKKYSAIKSSVQTRWGSNWDETANGNENQFDLNKTINRLVSENGIDKKVYKAHMEEHGSLDQAIILPQNWDFYRQYEGGMQPVRNMIRFCQSAQVFVHEELFEARRTMELLSLPYFQMFENISKKRGSERATNLTDRPLNQIVLSSAFHFQLSAWNNFSRHDEHQMLEEVAMARRIVFRQMGLRLGMYVRDHQELNLNDVDPNTDETLLYGLEDVDELPAFMIMGALCNPLMQNSRRMISAGLCTERQAKCGLDELLRRMAQFYERKSSNASTSTVSEILEGGNQWSTYTDVVEVIDTPLEQAKKEWKKWEKLCHPAFLPEMKSTRVMDAVDAEDQPKKPTYALGKVVNKQSNMANGLNLLIMLMVMVSTTFFGKSLPDVLLYMYLLWRYQNFSHN